MYCKHCGKELSDRALMCPECGEPVSEPQNIRPIQASQQDASACNTASVIGFIISLIGFVTGIILISIALNSSSAAFLSSAYIYLLPTFAGLGLCILGLIRCASLGGKGKGFAIAGICLSGIVLIYCLIIACGAILSYSNI